MSKHGQNIVRFRHEDLNNGFFLHFPIITKIALVYILLLLCLFALSFISYTNYRKDKEKTTLAAVCQLNAQSLSKIDEHLQALSYTSKMILIDNDKTLEMLDSSNQDGRLTYVLQRELDHVIENIFTINPHIHSVFIFNLHGKSEYKIRADSLTRPFNPVDNSWFRDCIEGFGKPVFIDTFLLPNVAEQTTQPTYIFSVARGIVRVTSSEVVGVILLNSHLDWLKNIMHQMKSCAEHRVILINRSGKTIYDTVETNITKQLEDRYAAYLDAAVSDKQIENVEINGEKVLFSYSTSPLTGWKIISMIPTKALNENIARMGIRTTIITINISIVAFIVFFIISKQITEPIKKLVLLMKTVEKGNFDIELRINNRDELGELAKGFNQMIAKLKHLIHESYINKIRQKELELQMLQNQINPHFIYNTLESIHMMAEIKRDQDTSKMTRALGKLIRYSMSRRNDIVTVKEELAHLQQYILLQKIRFEDIFTIHMDIAPAILDNKMLKMLLQPLVENAIYHGLHNRENGGKITISGDLENNGILFKVTDNGIGMEEEKIIAINRCINGEEQITKCIALRNVNKRIKLHFGEKYGIYLSGKPHEGTEVSVKLPVT